MASGKQVRLSMTAAKSLARHVSSLLTLIHSDPGNTRLANAARLARLDLLSLGRLIEKAQESYGKENRDRD